MDSFEYRISVVFVVCVSASGFVRLGVCISVCLCVCMCMHVVCVCVFYVFLPFAMCCILQFGLVVATAFLFQRCL